MSERIRTAAQADVAAMIGLAVGRREQYARYQPVFWRPAADAPDKHRAYLGSRFPSCSASSSTPWPGPQRTISPCSLCAFRRLV